MKLRELCTIQSGGTPSRSKPEYWENGSIPWVKISDFDGKYVSHTEEKITECGLLSSSAKVFPKGTLLYTIFATLGEVCILDIDAATNQAIAGITIKNDNVDEYYLFYFLTSLKTYVNRIGRGVAQNNINMSILREIEVPLPSIVRQKRIADILGKADQLIEKKERQLITLDELVKSRFVELTEKAQAVQIRMGDIATYLNGYAFKPEQWEESGLPIIRIQNLNDSSAPYNFFSGNLAEKYLVHSGDVLVSWATHLEAYIWKGGDAWLNQHIFKVVFDKMEVDKTYFVYACEEALRQAFRNAHGFKPTMEHIKKADFDAAIVKLPSIEVQKQFADFEKRVDKSKLAVKQSLEKLETLKKSLMQQYFG